MQEHKKTELLGREITGLVIDQNETDYFVQKEGIVFHCAKSLGDYQLGEPVQGFTYENKKHQWRIIPNPPKVLLGHYQLCTVTDVRRDLGVFVDIGLLDKDIVVSLDELPDMHALWPKTGDRLMITVIRDELGRLWGILAEDHYFTALAQKAPESIRNQNLEALVYRTKKVGTYLITKERYLAFLHPSERSSEPRLGEQVAVRVIDVKENGTINVSMRPRGYEVIEADAQMILTFLNRDPNHRLYLTDHSQPEDIQRQLNISKAQFKRAIGYLLKHKKIQQHETYIELFADDLSMNKN